MKELERTLKALANKRRLAIVKYLKAHQPTSVGTLAAHIRLSFKATSRHLGVLSAADVVEKNQEGLHVFYRLSANQKPAAKSVTSLL